MLELEGNWEVVKEEQTKTPHGEELWRRALLFRNSPCIILLIDHICSLLLAINHHNKLFSMIFSMQGQNILKCKKN